MRRLRFLVLIVLVAFLAATLYMFVFPRPSQ